MASLPTEETSQEAKAIEGVDPERLLNGVFGVTMLRGLELMVGENLGPS